MKTRNGFVSNSSTTSFTCEICGAKEAGSDCVDMEEYGFCNCENGHTICLDHRKKPQTDDELESYNNKIIASLCPICSFEKLSGRMELNFLRHEMNCKNKKEVFVLARKKASTLDELYEYIGFKKNNYGRWHK